MHEALFPGSQISKESEIQHGVELESPVRTYRKVRIKSRVKIGAYSFVNDRTTIYSGTSIGRYCSVGKGCELGALGQPSNWLSTSPVQYSRTHFPNSYPVETRPFPRPEPLKIGNDVWVGAGAIISRGVTIGDGALVGSGSMVDADLPDYAICSGAPAKVIGYRFPPEIIARLQKSRWWDRPLKDLNGVDFDDINLALDQLEALSARESLAPTNGPDSVLTRGRRERLPSVVAP